MAGKSKRDKIVADLTVSPAAMRRQLDRMVESENMTKSPQLSTLLDLLVSSVLNGKRLTEYAINSALAGEDTEWSAKEKHNVRVYILRLRKLLKEYYESNGAEDPVVFTAAGRQVFSKYNPDSPYLPAAPNPLNADYNAALWSFFGDPETGDFRCVVTGGASGWHYFDGDSGAPELGNIIPLSERLRDHIEGLRWGIKKTNLPELEPQHLIRLARKHFEDWQIMPAYGCAHLAFQMGEPPFGYESADVRVLRLSDMLSHVRHRFNESVVAYILRNRMKPLIERMTSIDPRSLCHLGLQLSGLLDEVGCIAAATVALALVEGVAKRFSSLVYQPGSLNRYSILRRRAQLGMERNPFDKRFETLTRRAEEHIYNSANLPLTSQVVKTARLLRQGTRKAAEEAHELLKPTVERFRKVIIDGHSLERPAHIDSSNVTQILAYAAIAACRVRPGGWEDDAHELITKATYLSLETGFSHPPEFWETVSLGTYEAYPSSRSVLRMPTRHIMPRLRRTALDDIEYTLSCLGKMLVTEKFDSALQWRSPWSVSTTAKPKFDPNA